jgi:hypothetical protein
MDLLEDQVATQCRSVKVLFLPPVPVYVFCGRCCFRPCPCPQSSHWAFRKSMSFRITDLERMPERQRLHTPGAKAPSRFCRIYVRAEARSFWSLVLLLDWAGFQPLAYCGLVFPGRCPGLVWFRAVGALRTSGAKVRGDFAGFVPGINPRPTLNRVFGFGKRRD